MLAKRIEDFLFPIFFLFGMFFAAVYLLIGAPLSTNQVEPPNSTEIPQHMEAATMLGDYLNDVDDLEQIRSLVTISPSVTLTNRDGNFEMYSTIHNISSFTISDINIRLLDSNSLEEFLLPYKISPNISVPIRLPIDSSSIKRAYTPTIASLYVTSPVTTGPSLTITNIVTETISQTKEYVLEGLIANTGDSMVEGYRLIVGLYNRDDELIGWEQFVNRGFLASGDELTLYLEVPYSYSYPSTHLLYIYPLQP